MGVDLLIYAAISITLLLLSRAFMRKGNVEKSVQTDDRPTTLSRRSAFINYVIGARLIGPGFGWADDANRFSVEEKTGEASGGKGFGGGSQDITQTVWYSAGWHVLCPGPAESLLHIEENGEIVWEGPIDRETTPSGTLIEAEGVGKFRIYWGELDQPIDPYLQNVMGIGSRWPGACHVVWEPKRLGGSQTWPQVEYLIRCAYNCVGTIPSPYVLDDGEAWGVNGAHALAQVLTAEFPYGGGLGADLADIVSFSEFADVCVDEHLACNILVGDGETLDRVVQGILTDLGVAMSEHDGRLVVIPIRKRDDALPVFSDDVIVSPDPEIATASPEEGIERLVFTFKDEEYSFRDNDVKTDDDSQFEETQRYQSSEVALYCPTHVKVATTIVARRLAEGFGDQGNVKLQAIHASGRMIPGQTFSLPGVGPLVILGVQQNATSPLANLECFLDAYSVDPGIIEIDDGNANPSPPRVETQHDLATDFFELPESISGGANRLAVLRIRAAATSSGAFVWFSGDGESYIQYGQQNTAATGGLLVGTLTEVTEEVIENGPVFEVLGPDIARVRDLSSDLPNWQGGSQVAVVGSEAFFLRSIEAQPADLWEAATGYTVGEDVVPAGSTTGLRYVCTTGGTSGALEPEWPTDRLGVVVDGTVVWEARGYLFALKGLIRARLGSVAAAHAADDTIFIASVATLSSFAGPLIVPGTTLCMKTQPYAPRSTTSVSAASPKCKAIVGSGTGLNYLVDETGEYFVTETGDRLIIGD